MFVAGHDELGCYGVQVWIRKGCRFFFHGWRVHSLRLIEITCICKCTHYVFVVISAHAPHEGAEESTTHEFWSLCCSVIFAAKARGVFVLLCLDANARIGEESV